MTIRQPGLCPEHVIIQVQRYRHIGYPSDVEGISNDRSGLIFSLVHCDRSHCKTENPIGIAARWARGIRGIPSHPQNIVLRSIFVVDPSRRLGATEKELKQ